jgi:hypothetical protein
MESTTPPADQQALIQAAVAELAGRLVETEPKALEQLERIVRRFGLARAQTFLQQALEVESQGGLWLPNRTRRRTLGGVFFYLVRSQISKEERWAIWPELAPKPKAAPFDWESRLTLIPDLLKQRGGATTMKITLIGRPGRIVEKGEVVLTSMQQSAKPPSLPHGLPPLPTEPTTYIVYIARKQWQTVAKAITNPEDALIVEGLPVLDKRLGTIAVFAQNVTTKRLQQAKREAQKAKGR